MDKKWNHIYHHIGKKQNRPCPHAQHSFMSAEGLSHACILFKAFSEPRWIHCWWSAPNRSGRVFLVDNTWFSDSKDRLFCEWFLFFILLMISNNTLINLNLKLNVRMKFENYINFIVNFAKKTVFPNSFKRTTYSLLLLREYPSRYAFYR